MKCQHCLITSNTELKLAKALWIQSYPFNNDLFTPLGSNIALVSRGRRKGAEFPLPRAGMPSTADVIQWTAISTPQTDNVWPWQGWWGQSLADVCMWMTIRPAASAENKSWEQKPHTTQIISEL